MSSLTPGSLCRPTSSISVRICGWGPHSRTPHPWTRSRRATMTRSIMSEASANTSSERSTRTSFWARMALISARRRQPCVVRSSSPAQRNTGGWSSKTTIPETYSNQPVLVQPIYQMSSHWPQYAQIGKSTCATRLVSMATVDEVTDARREVMHPELGLDFVELGLIYGIEIQDPGAVKVTYTLTTPGCPIGPQVAEQIAEFVGEIDGVTSVDSELTFSPPWPPERMTDDAKFALGF